VLFFRMRRAYISGIAISAFVLVQGEAKMTECTIVRNHDGDHMRGLHAAILQCPGD